MIAGLLLRRARLYRYPQRQRHVSRLAGLRWSSRGRVFQRASLDAARMPVVVEDQAHPATQGLGRRFALLEEFYTFQENPARGACRCC